MIKRLQRKFIRITMASAFAIFFVLMAGVNLMYFVAERSEISKTFDILAEYNGRFPAFDLFGEAKNQNREIPFQTRYFVVQTDSAGNITYLSIDKIAAINTQSAIQLANAALGSGKNRGSYGIYQYEIVPKYYGKLLIFIDCREQTETARMLLIGSCVLTGFILLVLFVLVYFFSGKAMAPVAESYEKQKQFITDAGHELKTPLAIISANTDVLEMCGEKNEWTTSIKKQVGRMDELIRQLITLTKLDEATSEKNFALFDLSEAVADTVSPFHTLAGTKGKSFTAEIRPGIKYNGNEADLRTLISVLCDNAVKYSNEGGKISVFLGKKGKSVILKVYNTCDSIDRAHLSRLFDRFYTGDASRSRQTGGYGIGLSIAGAIVERHKGKITAESADGRSVTFTAVL